MFYSSVILNGTETDRLHLRSKNPFYSSVILNGTETSLRANPHLVPFYSSVIIITMSFLV